MHVLEAWSGGHLVNASKFLAACSAHPLKYSRNVKTDSKVLCLHSPPPPPLAPRRPEVLSCPVQTLTRSPGPPPPPASGWAGRA